MQTFPGIDHEIWFCHDSFPRLSTTSVKSADGQTVSRWSDGDLAPPKAHEFSRSALETLAKTCNIHPSRLTTAVQTRQADATAYPGRVFGGVVLLLKAEDGDKASVELVRSRAMEFVRLLGAPVRLLGHASSTGTGIALEKSQSSLTFDDLVGATFLGMPIELPMTVDIPGFDSCRLERRFQRRPLRLLPQTVQLTVTGKLRQLKCNGKANQLFVTGRRASNYAPFGDKPILFSDTYFEKISLAVAAPGTELILALLEQTLDQGREKMRVQYFLTGLELIPPKRSKFPSGDGDPKVANAANPNE